MMRFKRPIVARLGLGLAICVSATILVNVARATSTGWFPLPSGVTPPHCGSSAPNEQCLSNGLCDPATTNVCFQGCRNNAGHREVMCDDGVTSGW